MRPQALSASAPLLHQRHINLRRTPTSPCTRFPCPCQPGFSALGDGDAFLLRERGHDGDDHIAYHPAAIEERFLETAPAYSPIVELLEMSQCLPRALTAEAI